MYVCVTLMHGFQSSFVICMLHLCGSFLVIYFADMSIQERDSISDVLNVVKAHANTLETFREDHSGLATSIEEKPREICQQQYRVGFSDIIFCLMFIR